MLKRTTTQSVKTALLVGTHLPLVFQKNLVASNARKGNLVNKVAKLHQLGDARIARKANIEETIRNPRHAMLVARVSTRKQKDKRLACRACPESLATRQACSHATSVTLARLVLNQMLQYVWTVKLANLPTQKAAPSAHCVVLGNIAVSKVEIAKIA